MPEDFKDSYIYPGEFFMLPKFITGLSLKNSGGDEIKLYDPNGELVDSIKYSGQASETKSWMRNYKNDLEWTTTPTPNAQNVFTIENLNPVSYFEIINTGEQIILDASESYDPEGEPIWLEWKFNKPVFKAIIFFI